MLGSVGFQELLIILLIVVIIFGASKLPQLGRGIGEGIKNFRDSLRSATAKKDDDGSEPR
ncbi:MAG: twin-arginine translocase TatA/TatE family subunit [Thermoanaerobaculaceae bacterium]|nr:twin-arginine translocase TatA/TatE family subunit [Thermoanaerobaculaceae bacterium]MDI9620829.1 twin-arginine translocase TatA/TatE family subunit [Acidobacteriota bacterium]NLH12578.1 twin-arginine translocase TatA/TatE family subunit [Holophagae bacterium]HPW54697.1 twin-arginine translocase TatA/TatE family subunit [Thermoanaerobaculaceae bacterium]